MNRYYYYSRPLFEKSESIKLKSIIFRYPFLDCFLLESKKRMKLVKLPVIFEVFRVSILIELAFSLKSFEQCFNYQGKLKKHFMVT